MKKSSKTRRVNKVLPEVKALQAYKEINRLSDNELARMIGVSQVSVNYWICERRTPGNDNLEKIKDFLSEIQQSQSIIQDENVTFDSRTVAKWMDKEHHKLLRDIRTYIDELKVLSNKFEQSKIGYLPKHEETKIGLLPNNPYNPDLYFIETTYKQPNGKTNPRYDITIKGCEFTSHKLTGIKGTMFTARYINEFHKMKDTFKFFNNTPNQEPQQTELLQDESSEQLTPLEQDINYLQQRINRLKDIKDLDQLHDELDTVTKLSQFMKIEHKLDE